MTVQTPRGPFEVLTRHAAPPMFRSLALIVGAVVVAALGPTALTGCGGGAQKPKWEKVTPPAPETAPRVEVPPSRVEPSSGASGDLAIPLGYPTGPEHYLEEGMAPTPYTAEQIRDACPPGRMNRFRVTNSDGKIIMVQRFVETNPTGAKIQQLTGRRNWDDPQRDPPTRSDEVVISWIEMQSHASYPADKTAITRDRVKVGAGEYDCWKIQVEEGLTTAHYWFAVHLAGPPVLTEIFRGRERILTMELVSISLR